MSILAMNQTVFGSNFETTRKSRVVINAVETDLVIPESAIEMSYEEMEYVDGGKFKTYIGNNALIELGRIGGMSILQITGVVASVAAAIGIAVGSAGSLSLVSISLLMEAAATLVFGLVNSVAFFQGLRYYFSDNGFQSQKTSLLFFFDFYSVKRL